MKTNKKDQRVYKHGVVTFLAIVVALLVILIISTLFTPAQAQQEPATQGRVIASADEFAVLPFRDRIEPENTILNQRLEQLLPPLMDQAGLDMWLVINREYAEDPVYFSLVPQPTFAARRTTMLVFNRTENGTIERLSVNTYPLGDPYESAWSGGDLDEQWAALASLIERKDPARIGINVSTHWPEADGLTKALHQRLLDALPESYHPRLTSAEQLSVRWLEIRTQAELDVYAQAVGLARGVIAEAFSSRVITPGASTTDDVAWYIRQRFADLNLPAWFMPYVTFQRHDNQCSDDMPFCPTAVNGDWPLHPNTAYAIEGNIRQPLPEWDNQTIQIMLEQTAYFDGERVVYAAGRQTEWHLVR